MPHKYVLYLLVGMPLGFLEQYLGKSLTNNGVIYVLNCLQLAFISNFSTFVTRGAIFCTSIRSCSRNKYKSTITYDVRIRSLFIYIFLCSYGVVLASA